MARKPARPAPAAQLRALRFARLREAIMHSPRTLMYLLLPGAAARSVARRTEHHAKVTANRAPGSGSVADQRPVTIKISRRHFRAN